MHYITLILVITSYFLKIAASKAGRVCDPDIISGRTPDNQFSVPPPSCAPGNYTGVNTYTVGTALTITWTCTVSPVNLAIVQENAAQPLLVIARNLTASYYTWNGFPPQPLSNGNTFFFELFRPSDNSGALFASDYINITGKDSSSSNSIATSTIVAPTSNATATLTSSSSTSTSPADNNNNNTSSNNATAIGAGVGGGVGAALVLATGAVLLYWRRRGRNSTTGVGGQESISKQHNETTAQYQDGHMSSDTKSALPVYEKQELDARSQNYHPYSYELSS